MKSKSRETQDVRVYGYTVNLQTHKPEPSIALSCWEGEEYRFQLQRSLCAHVHTHTYVFHFDLPSAMVCHHPRSPW